MSCSTVQTANYSEQQKTAETQVDTTTAKRFLLLQNDITQQTLQRLRYHCMQ